MNSDFHFEDIGDASVIIKNYSDVIHNISQKENHDYLEQYNNEIFIYKLPAMVYTAILMTLGIPGNIIVLYIYFFKWRRSTSRMFILFLAALDTLNCSTNFPVEIYLMRNSLKMDHPFVCKVSRYSTYVMNSSSALILVGIAADRFKRICKPYQRAFSAEKSRRISIAAILFSIATCWPSLIMYGTRRIDLGNAIGKVCLLENSFDQTSYPIIFFSYMVSSTFILFAVILVLYYFVGLQIYKHRKFKIKNCTHVQKIIDEKSFTNKSEKSGDKSKSSSSAQNNIKNTPEANGENGAVVIKEVTDVQPEEDDNELKPYQLGLPAPDPDPGTSCGLLTVPHKNEEISSLDHSADVSTRNISYESRVTCEQYINEVQPNENDCPGQKKYSPQRRKSRDRRKPRRVRYLLVRGASTLNASGVARCSSCLTVRIGRSTLMLFLITVIFVLSFLPFYVLIIVRQSNPAFVKSLSKGGLMAYHVFLRSYLLSSVVNPFIYSFCNAQFREICKETFSKLFLHRQSSFVSRSKVWRHKH